MSRMSMVAVHPRAMLNAAAVFCKKTLASYSHASCHWGLKCIARMIFLSLSQKAQISSKPNTWGPKIKSTLDIAVKTSQREVSATAIQYPLLTHPHHHWHCHHAPCSMRQWRSLDKCPSCHLWPHWLLSKGKQRNSIRLQMEFINLVFKYLQCHQMNCMRHAPHPDVWGTKLNKIPLQQCLQVFNHGVIVWGIVCVDGNSLWVVNVSVQ